MSHGRWVGMQFSGMVVVQGACLLVRRSEYAVGRGEVVGDGDAVLVGIWCELRRDDDCGGLDMFVVEFVSRRVVYYGCCDC